jgi:DNA mismatch repair protein MutS
LLINSCGISGHSDELNVTLSLQIRLILTKTNSTNITVSETPLMKQYNAIKAKHPQALLLFRVGDFYETFGEDAVETARVLGIVLTSRRNGSSDIELAGFPHHSLETYLPKLVRAGKRVAICDQLEDPKLTKSIVKRGVTELVTPGVSFNDNVLEQKKNNFLCAIHFNQDQSGIAFLDISTGEFFIAEGNMLYLDKLIQGFQPSEIIYQKNAQKHFENLGRPNVHAFRLEDWVFTSDFAYEALNKHFGTKSLKGFGVDELKNGIIAGGAILHYLGETHHDKLSHITQVGRIEEEKYVWLDRFTIRNLELIHSQHENATTLIDILDQTLTPMGGRMMKRWTVLPLKDLKAINQRLFAVQELKENTEASLNVADKLKLVGDLERLISKTAVGKINPKEAMQLLRTLRQIEPIKSELKFAKSELLQNINNKLNACQDLMDRISTTLHDDPAVQIGKGKVIADGYHQELDELRAIAYSGKDYLEDMQKRESELTGIVSLKINYNNVFGYYIEVRNTHKDKVPEHWVRKQTLVSAERYITEELKEYEGKILGAEDKIHVLESKIYQDLISFMSDFTTDIQTNSNLLGQLDCLLSFATVAQRNNYALPKMNEGLAINIKNGRHPVIEKQLKQGEQFIPNDVYLDDKEQQIIMITGPNMSGKSAILRQTALICLMAQMGCFVPAESAECGVLDKIFTRVGASDNISSGESTFMVEMNETSSILNNLSDRSLILLDEIGRGTSTYDGISIAWAIAEFLHEHPKSKAKTLFATHYHELNEMSKQFPRIKNFNVQVKEIGQKILFLRKLIEGGSEHSFGIHVAQLAGMPNAVVQRASKILEKLEESQKMNGEGKKVMKKEEVKEVMNSKDMQLSFFQLNDPVLEQIREELVSIDINVLTPVEALMKLNEIKKLTGG